MQGVKARAEETIEPATQSLRGSAGRLRVDHWAGQNVNRGPALMLHRGGQTRHSWARSAVPLALEGWQVFTVDLRGHGESDWAADGGYDIGGFVAVLYLLVEKVKKICVTTAAPVVIGKFPVWLVGGNGVGNLIDRTEPTVARTHERSDPVDNGALHPRSAVDELLDLIPTATAVDVAGASHMVAGDDNAVFVEHTDAFIKALPEAEPRA